MEHGGSIPLPMWKAGLSRLHPWSSTLTNRRPRTARSFRCDSRNATGQPATPLTGEHGGIDRYPQQFDPLTEVPAGISPPVLVPRDTCGDLRSDGERVLL